MPERARFTILSMMKDEGHSLIEWVAYHRIMGFDNICIYTNDCNDGTDKMLMRLEEMGYVRHFDNPVPDGRKPQPHALSLADENPAVTDSDWILVMDADEFLNVKIASGTVRDLVTLLPRGTDAVAVTWRFFGSNGLTSWNPGLVIDKYTRAAPDTFRKGWGVKTLFKPYPHMKFGIHRPAIHGARRIPERAQAMLQQSWVNGSGKPMPEDFALSGWRSTKPTLGYDLAEMNHYAVKSFEAYLLRRMRGNVNNKTDKYNAAYFSIFDRNEIEVYGAQRHAPAVRTMIGEMLSDTRLAFLYQEAMNYHGGRVDALRQTGTYDEWVEELREASKVPLDKVDEVLFVQHLPKVWQERVKEMQAQGVPDATIAKMINETQTAKKGENRAALRASAEGHPAPDATPHPKLGPVPEAPPPVVAQPPAPEMPSDAAPAAERPAAAPPKEGPGAKKPAAPAPEPRPEPFETRTKIPVAPRRTPTWSEGASPPKATSPLSSTSLGPASAPLLESLAKPVSDRVLPGMGNVMGNNANPSGSGKGPDIAKKTTGPRIHLVATLKNEGPYVIEWIAHYRRLGVTDFTLFSNDCTDGTNLILNRLAGLGVVRHFDNPIGERMDPQRRAYSRAGQMEAVRSSDWVLILDADEFLNIHVGQGTLLDLIEVCEAPDAISIPWRLMGSAGRARMSEAPVTQRFERGSDFDTPENGMVWGFKTMFRPAVFDYFGVHRPKFKKDRTTLPPLRWTNASGDDISEKFIRKGWRFGRETLGYGHAQVNHYAIKSREEFLLKRLRGTANSKNKDRIDLNYWKTYDINTHADRSIGAAERADQLDYMMSALLKDHDLAALHRATHDHAHRTIASQLEDPTVAKFVETGTLPEAAE